MLLDELFLSKFTKARNLKFIAKGTKKMLRGKMKIIPMHGCVHDCVRMLVIVDCPFLRTFCPSLKYGVLMFYKISLFYKNVIIIKHEAFLKCYIIIFS